MDNPIPMPLGLVVKKALNNWSAVSESIPMRSPTLPRAPGGFVLLRSNNDLMGRSVIAP